VENLTLSSALVAEQCEGCRIEVSTKGVVIDNSTGDLAYEMAGLVIIILLGLSTYAGYQIIKKKFR
jgi:hypothetical protein